MERIGNVYWYGRKLASLLLIVWLPASAGVNIIPRPTGRNLGKAMVVDTTYLQFYYAFNADNARIMDTYEDYQCLEVGKNYMRYHSVFLQEGELVVGKWLEEHKNPKSVPNVTTPGKRKLLWSEYQYAELYVHGGKLTGYYCFPMHLTQYNAFCIEDYPLQKWEVRRDTITICGQTCQKAVCHFRGRDFVAWFAPSIPLQYGPWKFGGLPGLILKVADTKGEYSFECTKIERKRKPLHKFAFEKYTARKRTEIVNLQRRINENYFRMVGAHDGNIPLDTTNPYNPLELE